MEMSFFAAVTAIILEFFGGFAVAPDYSAEGRYYVCQYVSAAQTAPDERLVTAAEKALLSSSTYKAVYDSVKSELPDREPLIEAELSGAFSYDLNGDGAKEYAFLYLLSPKKNCDNEMAGAVFSAVIPNTPCIAVLSDSNGNCHVSDIRYAVNAEVFVLSYGDFAQFVISGGVSNNSSHADYYSYYDGFQLELREFKKGWITDNVFLVNTMAQSPAVWLYLWDNEERRYITPKAEYLSEQTSSDIISRLPISDEERQEIKGQTVRLLADKFYIVGSSYYTESGGIFTKQPPVSEYYCFDERHERYGEDFSVPTVSYINYDTVIENAVKK